MFDFCSHIITDRKTVVNRVKKKKGVYLIDFYATWCGPCKVFGNTLEEFSKLHPDLKIFKINVDECTDITETFNVMSLPTIIYTTLDEIWRHNGLMTLKQLENKIYASNKFLHRS